MCRKSPLEQSSLHLFVSEDLRVEEEDLFENVKPNPSVRQIANQCFTFSQNTTFYKELCVKFLDQKITFDWS